VLQRVPYGSLVRQTTTTSAIVSTALHLLAVDGVALLFYGRHAALLIETRKIWGRNQMRERVLGLQDKHTA